MVKLRIQLRLSLRGIDLVETDKDAAVVGLNQLIARLTSHARRLAREVDWQESLARLRTIPGIGKLCALGLRAMYGRVEFFFDGFKHVSNRFMDRSGHALQAVLLHRTHFQALATYG